MTENKRFRVNDLVKYNYSEIGEYIDENHTDRPLMNNKVCELLNDLYEERNYFERKKCEYWNKYNLAHLDNIKLREENEQLKQSYKEFEDECQSTFNAMNRKQNDLYRKNFKLKEENKQLRKEVESKERLIKAYDQWAYDLKNDGVLDE